MFTLADKYMKKEKNVHSFQFSEKKRISFQEKNVAIGKLVIPEILLL